MRKRWDYGELIILQNNLPVLYKCPALNGIEIGKIEQTDSTLNMGTSCNVSVHIYDDNGYHVGLNETGGVDLEIPGAYYSYLNYNNDTYTVASVYYGEKNYTFIIMRKDVSSGYVEDESYTVETEGYKNFLLILE